MVNIEVQKPTNAASQPESHAVVPPPSTRQPWVKPTFARLRLADALAGGDGTDDGTDLSTS
jgi:hypothetical protein